MANRHQRVQRSHPFSVTVGTGPHGSVLLTFSDRARGRTVLDVPMPLGAAYELAAVLTAHVQGALAGAARPWDDDPGRVPFASRPGRRHGASGAATGAVPATPAGGRPA
jgi:hypothetical protein